jgi:hypothetical protein
MENNKGEEEALELGGLLPKKFVGGKINGKRTFLWGG